MVGQSGGGVVAFAVGLKGVEDGSEVPDTRTIRNLTT